QGTAATTAMRYAALVAMSAPLGLSVMAWVSLVARPAILAATPVPEFVVLIALGVLALYLPLYVLLTTTPVLRVGPLKAVERIQHHQALAFIAASIVDWAMAGALLWCCLAALGTALPVAAVMAAYALAVTLGMLSFVPGGLGVFDITLISLL